MRRPFVAGNWKMCGALAQNEALLKAVAAGMALAQAGGRLKNLGHGLHEQAQQVAAFLISRIVAPVQEQGESVDGRGLGAVAPCGLGRDYRKCFPKTGIGPDGDVSFDPAEEFLAA